MRRGWKRGDHLVKDEESGFTEYASKVGRDYYGVLKRKEQMDAIHPQTFIRAKEDPYPVDPISQPLREYNKYDNVEFYIDSTTIEPVLGAGLHLFRPGIGSATVEYDLFVY